MSEKTPKMSPFRRDLQEASARAQELIGKAGNYVRRHPAGVAIVLVTSAFLGGAVGQALHREDLANDKLAAIELANELNEQYLEKVEIATLSTMYSEDQVVGLLMLEQGEGIYDLSRWLAEQNMSQEAFEAYEDDPGQINGVLLSSAKLHENPQVGDCFGVVETDIDPEAANGNEYVVVEFSQVDIPEELREYWANELAKEFGENS